MQESFPEFFYRRADENMQLNQELAQDHDVKPGYVIGQHVAWAGEQIFFITRSWTSRLRRAGQRHRVTITHIIARDDQNQPWYGKYGSDQTNFIVMKKIKPIEKTGEAT